MKVVSIPIVSQQTKVVPATPLPLRAKSTPQKIALPTMEGIQFERVNQIVSLEAKGNYTLIHFLNKRQILVCKTLKEIELLVENRGPFSRIHRSHAINLDHLQKYIRGKGGYVIMDDGSSMNVSSGKKPSFMEDLLVYFGS